jgi:uncharacterized membrane protein
MKNANVVLLVILVLLVGAALQLMHYYPLMPGRMATHFGASLAADGWSAKQSFFTTYVLVEVGMLIVLIVPVLLSKRLPVSMINSPNRDYWFAPERREATWFEVSVFAFWMAALTLGFMIVVAEATFRANLASAAGPALGSYFFWGLGIYVAAVAVGSIRFFWRFARVPRDPNAPPTPE